MVGMKVVVVSCDSHGNVDFEDLKNKVEKHKDNLAALMVTYPSTHGVFEEKIVDIVAGPDSYRDLPKLILNVLENKGKSVNTILSLEETYHNIEPVRLNSNGITAYISIMRGCDNMCSFLRVGDLF